jgi:predicted Rdx family selenoprotein
LTEAGHEALALEGAKSQYDVVADGTVVFSKQREGRFPDEGEVVGLVAALATEPG